MPRILTPDGPMLSSLPLPLAQLYEGGCRARNPRDRHDHAYYLWELGMKLLAIVAVAESGAEFLGRLARPSAGHWWEIVRRLYPALGEADPGRFGAVARLLSGRDRLGGEPLLRLRSRLRQQLRRRDGKSNGGVRVDNLFELILTYRNRFLGHNVAVRRPVELVREIGSDLLLGVAELYRHLDPLVGGRLIYVDSVSGLEARGEILQGNGAAPLPSINLAGEGVRGLKGGRVYLAPEAGRPTAASLRPLHPLLYFMPEDRTFWFLNGQPSERKAELICCTNGDYQVLALDRAPARAIFGPSPVREAI